MVGLRYRAFVAFISVSTLLILLWVLLWVPDACAGAPAGYAYVKTYFITGSLDGALHDYQLRFAIHTGNGSDDYTDLYLFGIPKSWPNDIRFTDGDDNALPYWIESSDAEKAIVWVKMNDIAAAPERTTLKVYYGKAGDTGASSGPDTFILFEDFGDDARRTTVWSESDGDALAGYPTVHAFENGGYHIRQDSPRDTAAMIMLAQPLDTATWCTVTLQDVSEIGSRKPPWITTRVGFNGNDWGQGYWGITQGNYDTLPDHTYQMVWTDGRATNNIQLFEDGELLSTGSGKFTGHRPDIGIRTASDASGEWYFRNFYARAYTPNPPREGNADSNEPVVTPKPTATPKPPITPRPTAMIRPAGVDTSDVMPFALCGGCVCSGIVLFLIVLLVVVVYDERRNR